MANNDQLWQEAKKRCRLDDKDIALAKRLGLNPRSLIKNIPSKSEPWKAPVKDWLHEIEAKRSKKAEQKQRAARKRQRCRIAPTRKSNSSSALFCYLLSCSRCFARASCA